LIEGFAFEPETITVAAGEAVTLANADSADHTVTHDGADFGSDTLAQGAEFHMRFDPPGTYHYVCASIPR
jgi:plastocyanin